MNKILFSLLGLVLTFSLASAQSVSGDNNNNGIRDDVDNVIAGMTTSYSLNPPQVSAVNQVARSLQYILTINPQTRAQAVELAKRDAAATNCASSRLSGTLMDTVYSNLEGVTFNTPDRQSAYDLYTSLLGEDDNVTPTVVSACEDSYSNTSTSPGNNNSGSQGTGGYSYGSAIPSGLAPDNAINYPCTVMTQFMEYGSRASQVLTLQKFLSDTGYMEMWPTGYFGRNTEAAVRLWQARHNVDVRGYVGPNTRASIAAITCRGDQSAIERARRGVVVTYSSTKKVTTVATQSQTTTIIPTTNVNQNNTAPVVTTPVSTAKLSSNSGVFYRLRNPVNNLYFTYKTDMSAPTTICLERSGESNCSNPDNFVALQSQYKPGVYDAIPNGDRWILNFYFNQNSWINGGKVYLKSTSAIPDIYTITVSDTQ